MSCSIFSVKRNINNIMQYHELGRNTESRLTHEDKVICTSNKNSRSTKKDNMTAMGLPHPTLLSPSSTNLQEVPLKKKYRTLSSDGMMLCTDLGGEGLRCGNLQGELGENKNATVSSARYGAILQSSSLHTLENATTCNHQTIAAPSLHKHTPTNIHRGHSKKKDKKKSNIKGEIFRVDGNIGLIFLEILELIIHFFRIFFLYCLRIIEYNDISAQVCNNYLVLSFMRFFLHRLAVDLNNLL